MFNHTEQYLPNSLDRIPAAIREPLIMHGNGGVPVFFVLSGFVIAHSLRHTVMDGPGFGNFMTRRLVRLSPRTTRPWCSRRRELRVDRRQERDVRPAQRARGDRPRALPARSVEHADGERCALDAVRGGAVLPAVRIAALGARTGA
ncbi:MAG: hypothetical protein R2713_06890 [Ilumatobacteraceae bacterium]